MVDNDQSTRMIISKILKPTEAKSNTTYGWVVMHGPDEFNRHSRSWFDEIKSLRSERRRRHDVAAGWGGEGETKGCLHGDAEEDS